MSGIPQVFKERTSKSVRTRNKPHLDADTAYKIMVAIRLGVESYRKEKVMRFDPEKEEVI